MEQPGKKRKTSVKGEARELLLAAAEELIAEHGVNGVSVRAINAAAGVSSGILHYHFGSLDKVIEALLERHMVPLMEERMALYDILQKQADIGVRDVVAMLVMPLARKIFEDRVAGRRYIRFLVRLNHDHSPATVRIFEHYFGARVCRLTALLQRPLPRIPQEVLRLRLLAGSHAMLNTLADLSESAATGADSETAQLWQRVELLIEYLCGGLAAASALGDDSGVGLMGTSA